MAGNNFSQEHTDIYTSLVEENILKLITSSNIFNPVKQTEFEDSKKSLYSDTSIQNKDGTINDDIINSITTLLTKNNCCNFQPKDLQLGHIMHKAIKTTVIDFAEFDGDDLNSTINDFNNKIQKNPSAEILKFNRIDSKYQYLLTVTFNISKMDSDGKTVSDGSI